MNYKEHYNTLIEYRMTHLVEGYSEQHHIVPKCIGGSDDADNLVRLTAEEHYVAHQLLVKMHPGHRGLVKAAKLMTVDSNGGRVNNKLYGWLKRKRSEDSLGKTYEERYGIEKAAIVRHKLSTSHKGKKQSVEQIAKRVATMTGRPSPLRGRRLPAFSDEWRANMSKAAKGRTSPFKGKTRGPMNKVHKLNISMGKQGKSLGPQEQIECPKCHKSGGSNAMKRWHFDNCKTKEVA